MKVTTSHSVFSALVFSTCLSHTAGALAQTTETICPSGQTINATFTSGAAWDMCYTTENARGVVLSNIDYTTPDGTRRRVLGSASIAQIYTEFDDGTNAMNLTPTSGLGGTALTSLNGQDCMEGQLLSAQGRPVICQTNASTGYRIKFESQQFQEQHMTLFSASVIGSLNYIVRWNFHDNGTIEPIIGLSGTLPKTAANVNYGWRVGPANAIMAGFTNHYFWRLDFDLGSSASNDLVEESTATPTTTRLEKVRTTVTLPSETARSLDFETKRWWRVRDASETNGSVGHLSYELVTLNFAHQGTGNTSDAWLKHDVWFTRYKACEVLAVNNSTSNCGASVSAYNSSESINGADVVAWYRLSSHHLPRDEDEGRIPTSWDGIQLLPRDWMPQNPLTQ